MSPVFLNLADILQIHRDQIKHYGGSSEIRDMRLLESALAQPPAAFDDQFLHRDLFDMAAAYLFHIVSNHPFVDGNKRTGTVAAIVFLALNEVEIDPDLEEFEAVVFSVAKGKAEKQEVAEFLRK